MTLFVPAAQLLLALLLLAGGAWRRSLAPIVAGVAVLVLLAFPGASAPALVVLGAASLVVAIVLAAKKRRPAAASALAACVALSAIGVVRVPWLVTALFKPMAPKEAPAAIAAAAPVARLHDDEGELIESLDVDNAGNVFVSVMTKSLIKRIAPDGTQSVLATFPAAGTFDAGAQRGFVAALVVAPDGSVFANVNVNPKNADVKNHGVWHVVDGHASLYATLPPDVLLNGIALDPAGNLFLADSANASVWRVDAATHTAARWVKDDALAQEGSGFLPGPNGIKVHGDEIVVSNTSKSQIVAFPITSEGRPGAARVLATQLPADDFAFGTDNTLYVTTHAFNTVVALHADGTRAVVGDEAHGIYGPTSAVFGKTRATQGKLLVVGDGNWLYPFWRTTPSVIALDVEPSHVDTNAVAARVVP